MKKRVVNKNLKHYLPQVLKKKNVPFMLKEQNGVLYCFSDLSSREYHRCIENAMCERQRKNKRTPVCSLNEVLYKAPKKSFILLEKDREKAINIL